MTAPHVVRDGVSWWKVAVIAVICLGIGFYCGSRVNGGGNFEPFVPRLTDLIAEERSLLADYEICSARGCTDAEWDVLDARYYANENKRLDLLQDLLNELD